MEKLKKVMTRMAIWGTILVTAGFCYMPFREIIKEQNKQNISLETETAEQDSAQAEKEKTSGNRKEPAEKTEHTVGNSTGQKEPLPEVLLSAKTDSGRVETKLWQSKDGTFYFFLPGFAKEGSLRISEIEKGGSLTIGSAALKEGDAISRVSFEEEYQLTLSDKEGEALAEGALVFLYSSDIPVLSITTQSGSMEEINQEKGNEEPGTITLFDENGGLLFSGEAEKISGRGNSTWGLEKKPYQFKLKEGADLFGFGKAKSWNLMAESYDETKLRNPIMLGLAKELGMEYTPEGKSVDVYCNGEYYGVYYLCEKVQVHEERVNIRDMEANAVAAYTEQEREELERVTSEDGNRKWTGTQIEEGDISGGYLLERELTTRYQEEISGFITSQGDAYVLQSPLYASGNQVNYIADLVQEFQDAIEEQNGIHPVTGKHYSEYIDVDSFVQKYLVEEIGRNYDGGVTSSFFYKPQDSVSKKLFAGPAWDYDVVFGNCNLDGLAANPRGITALNDHIYGTSVFARLYEQEDFYEGVVSLYEETAVPYLNWLLEEGIDRMSAATKQSARLDAIRWESLENRFQYYEDYENNIRFLKYFIRERMDFLNQVWLQGAVYHSISFFVDGEVWKKIYVKDGETAGSQPVPSRYNSLFMGWRTESWDVPYDEYKPVYEDMTFYAVWQELPEEEVVLTS